MRYYAAEQMKKNTAIHINMDKYRIIMLSEKNRSHKSRILFAKNKTKNYICFTYVG